MNSDYSTFVATLATLRWIAVVGQLVAIGVVAGPLGLPLPLLPMLLAIAVLVVLNVCVSLRSGRTVETSPLEVFLHIVVDVVVLAFLIACSGGTANPFTSLFLLPIAFAALALPQRWIYATAALCGLGYAGAAAFGKELPGLHELAIDGFDLHLFGMAVNFLISAGVFAYILARLAKQRRQRDMELARMRERFTRDEGILALATHAASVAHELNTPLATMLLALEELSLEPLPEAAAQDVELLQTLAFACRERVQELARAGTHGEPVDPEQLVSRWSLLRPSIQLGRNHVAPPGTRVDAGVGHLLQALLDNAADASEEAGSSRVNLDLRCEGKTLHGEIRDEGRGFDPSRSMLPGTLYRSGKPHGLGVGLALSHAVVERLGGSLTMQAEPAGGTRVSFRVPLAEQETH